MLLCLLHVNIWKMSAQNSDFSFLKSNDWDGLNHKPIIFIVLWKCKIIGPF